MYKLTERHKEKVCNLSTKSFRFCRMTHATIVAIIQFRLEFQILCLDSVGVIKVQFCSFKLYYLAKIW